MPSQYLLLPVLLSATEVDIGPWPPPIQPKMLSVAVQLRPPPWPVITKDTWVMCSSVSSLFGDICGWYLRHYLEFTSQVLLQCYSCGVQAMLLWSNPAYECAFIYVHVYQHYCHTQIQFSGICVGSNVNWPALHVSVTNLRVIQLDHGFGCLSLAYLSTDLTFQFWPWIWWYFHIGANELGPAAFCNMHFLLLDDVDLLFVYDTSSGWRSICFKAIQELLEHMRRTCSHDGCKSLDCFIDLKERQVVLYFVQRSWGPYRIFLTQMLYRFSTVSCSVNLVDASRMSGYGSDANLHTKLTNHYRILTHSSFFAWNYNHLLGVAVVKSEEDGHGSAEAFSGVGNIIFKLHFYNLMIADP